MLRRGFKERSPSVGAFCQHRPPIRRSRLPLRRLISSTACLRNDGSRTPGQQPGVSPSGGAGGGSGWGRPLFANATAPSGFVPGAPQAPSSSTAALLPHEMEARKRMAAQRAEAERVEAERAAANAPKPGVGFRHTWNVDKQQEILQNVRREVKPRGTPGQNSQNQDRSQGRPLSEGFSRGSNIGYSGRPGYSTPPVYTGSDRQAKQPYMERPESLPGRGYSTPPVYNKPLSHESTGAPRPTFNDRAPASFSRERRPPRSLPNQPIGSEIFAPPKPLVQKFSTPLEATNQPPPSSRPSKLRGDNEIRKPQLARLLDTEGFFEKPKQEQAASRPDPVGGISAAAPAQTQNATGGWDSGLFSRTKAPRSLRENRANDRSAINDLRSTWNSVAQHEQTKSSLGTHLSNQDLSPDGGSWKSLTRRQQPGSGNGGDFWSMMEKNTLSPLESNQREPLDDWGKEFDKPKQREQTGTKNYDDNRPQPRRTGREPNEGAGLNTTEKMTRERTPPIDVPVQSAPFVSPDRYQHQERRSRWQEPDRDSRFEIESSQDRRGGKKPRGGRNSRYENAEEEDEVDYESYLDRRRKKAERKAQREAERTVPQAITLPELISISNLASALKVEKNLFLDQLAELGFEGISLDSIMAGDTAALVVQEYGFEPTVEAGKDEDLKPRPAPEDPSVLPPRPPVVTIMGHVDHGKTTLLDFLRNSSVAAGEHGGITQHIGAFSVSMSGGKQITFLDTPGHAAFLTMRQRGANVTDIVVLVVAADDSVKPQTVEALKHARSSKVPIIVAINKIDKDGTQVDRVKADLASSGVDIEDYGGDVQVVCVSGKTGQGMDDLEENILALSEILDMRAEPDGPAEGWILESSLKPIGKVATILVKRGTLRPGDFIVAGTTYAKIRHLRNEAGQEVSEAPPGTPVEILGWRDLPAAGDQVIQGVDERRVRQAAEYREGLRAREVDAASHEKISEQRRLHNEQRKVEKEAEEGKRKRVDGSWGTQEQTSDIEIGTKKINFVIKGDVHGSVEAVCAAIQEIGSNEVEPRVLLSSPGAINESDVEHAATSKSAIINFNLPVSGMIKRQAETAGVKIMDHSIIYHLTDDVKDYLSSFLGVDVSFKVLGEAEVLQIFPINIKRREYKNIAGCRIRNGTLERNHLFRVMRAGENIFEGKLESFKHGKKDIDEARKGGECGIGFEFFQDLQVGDQIQSIEEVQTKRTL